MLKSFILPVVLLSTFPLMAGSAEVSLRALEGFTAGKWKVKAVGAPPAAKCVTHQDTLILAGRSGSSCSFSAVTNNADTAVVAYQCAGGRTGRTEIRRDAAGIYTLNAQGVEAGLPFAERTMWHFAGPCNS